MPAAGPGGALRSSCGRLRPCGERRDAVLEVLDDAKTVELTAGRWRDDLGETIEGPKTLRLADVPLSRLPRYERIGG